MRTYGLALVSLFISLLIAACGGTSRPAASPTSGGPAGAEAIAPSGADDVAVTMDLAGMRANPLLARFLAEGRSKAAPAVDELLEKIDRVDVRASVPKEGAPNIVAVLWGRLSRDPRQLPSFKAAGEPKTLASGVTEWIEGSADAPHVFVVSDQVWVVTTGAMTDRARDHFTSTSAPPAAPNGDLIRLRANHAVFARAPEAAQVLGDVDKIDVILGANASALRAVLAFKDADSAKKAEKQVRALTALLPLAIAGTPECKALQKLSVDVSQSSSDLAIDVKDFADALASWDEKGCSRPSSTRTALAVDGSVNPPEPPPAPPQADDSVPTKKRLCGLVTKRHASSFDKNASTVLERFLVAKQVEKFEKDLADTDARSSLRPTMLTHTAAIYGEWEAAARRDCAKDKNAVASTRDVEIAGRIAKRTRALCKELTKFPTSRQCH